MPAVVSQGAHVPGFFGQPLPPMPSRSSTRERVVVQSSRNSEPECPELFMLHKVASIRTVPAKSSEDRRSSQPPTPANYQPGPQPRCMETKSRDCLREPPKPSTRVSTTSSSDVTALPPVS